MGGAGGAAGGGAGAAFGGAGGGGVADGGGGGGGAGLLPSSAMISGIGEAVSLSKNREAVRIRRGRLPESVLVLGQCSP